MMMRLVVIAILVVVGCDKGPNAGQKDSITIALIQQYAQEAFPRWALENRMSPCPASLAELSPIIGRKDAKDLWGNELIMFCGENLPPDVRGGMGVQSLGPDGKRDTDDDLRSWKY
jgi:hypothetical protein